MVGYRLSLARWRIASASAGAANLCAGSKAATYPGDPRSRTGSRPGRYPGGLATKDR
jgi:hypothetical protein